MNTNSTKSVVDRTHRKPNGVIFVENNHNQNNNKFFTLGTIILLVFNKIWKTYDGQLGYEAIYWWVFLSIYTFYSYWSGQCPQRPNADIQGDSEIGELFSKHCALRILAHGRLLNGKNDGCLLIL